MTLFQDWQEAHKNDEPLVPERIRQMWNSYGKIEGLYCRTCSHLIRVSGHSHEFLKCDLGKITRGPGTDWRAGWTACGKHPEAPKTDPKL